MTNEEMIAKLLPELISPLGAYGSGYNVGVDYCKEKLLQALSDGKLCLDPPTAEEIYQLYHKYSGGQGQAFVSAMISRIRNGREE